MYVAHSGKRRCVYKIWVEKSDGNKPLGKARLRWENDVKMNIKGVG